MLKIIKKISLFSLPVLSLSLFFTGSLCSQTKSNLDVFYALADSSVNMIAQNVTLPSLKLKVEFNNGGVYSVFNNHILEYLISKKTIFVPEKNENVAVLSYTIEKAVTEYSDLFRNGFLGPYMVQRKLSLKGNYFITTPGKINSNHSSEFIYYQMDSVQVDELKNLENNSFKFTNGTIPPEPFFTGLFEPVFALSTAAAAVILFFTVRSK
ncbi:MAG: hypothetical protein P4L27_15165 [Ignavibacteriaceae bacterium]|nr:hypothetical protein [Ignavibacteriaceae bacterium]